MWSSNARRRPARSRSSEAARRPRRKPRGDDEATGLGSILDQMVTARPWEAGMALGVLARRWTEVVGERLSQECEPIGLEAGTLLVRASSHAWAAQIRFLAGQVRDRAEEVVGGGRVGVVRVVVGPV